jgi:hypothetical protein
MEPQLKLCLDASLEREESELIQTPTFKRERLDVDDIG